ncbi:MAG: glutathione S-transferase family protein [Phenylobacterium sp.]|uniref:glutathione S-transferase family protein n=1 Tax=Phenylobacterium sp. TaxID=1871053 RepID=UPI0027327050|nr:glutathione S-transferase family protein [Phenylobacterium sp.]MDP3173751.1 glutathione S-transferase family protein [Phenylobacterium sp.]
MITLFHSPATRSTRILWLLEELGEPFDIEYVTVRRGEEGGFGDPRNPHPDKKVPAIVVDGEVVTESAAIVLYLTDAFPAAGLGPRVGEPGRAAYLTWLAYSAGVIEPALFSLARNQDPGPPAVVAWGDPQDMVQRLSHTLSNNPYVLGDRFSGADILVSSAIQFALHILPGHAEFEAYMARIGERQAFKRSLERDAG